MEEKELVPTPNNRIFRNKEFILTFPMQVRYLAKTNNLLADWLSRNPQPTQESVNLPRFEGTVALVYEGAPLDKKVLEVIDYGTTDEDYTAILQILNEGGTSEVWGTITPPRHTKKYGIS